MNLLTDPWLTMRSRGGEPRALKPADIADPDVLDLLAPRPDFRGALHQFLVGLLQTTFAPEDEDDWLALWREPPSVADLEAAFAQWTEHFVLDGGGKAFLQDATPSPDFADKDIRDLLIDLGAVSNLHFNKPERINGLCSACAATALFGLQANAPSGGVGHRVSLRGGGPLTSLLVPKADADSPATLWQRLWLNVLPTVVMIQPGGRFDGRARADILPWLAPTRTSEKKGGQTTPDQAHALQAYWGMPRRIRLDWKSAVAGRCDLCGAKSAALLTHYRTKNYGINYTGWQHPLTPYYLDPKKKELPLSVKGQKGGIGYRHWLGLTLGSADGQPESALVIRHYLTERWDRLQRLTPGFQADVWAFGYDVDNMKARCWYDATLPTYRVDPERHNEFVLAVGDLIEVAGEAARQLHRAVKAAWADRPRDLKDEPAVGQSFWAATETLFYRSLEALAQAGGLEPRAKVDTFRAWLTGVRGIGLDLFDDWVTGEYEKDWDIERTVRARKELFDRLNRAKPMKALWKIINQQEVSA
ncbi:MAG: type I-E CRISPR-associated protein Cse1/CasA [Rhodocyclaceae bacterium]